MTNKHKLVVDPDSLDAGTHELKVNERALQQEVPNDWQSRNHQPHVP